MSQTMVERVARFFIDEGDGLFVEEQFEKLKAIIIDHIIYGTIKCWTDEKGISAVARWNWVEGNKVEILDVAVRKDLRHNGIVKRLAQVCLDENPQCVGMYYQDKNMTKQYYRKRSYFFRRGDKHENSTAKELRH